MEYVWKCFDDEGVTRKARNRKITTFIIYFALIILLTLVVAVYSYAAKSLTLEEAVDADVLRPASGFLPKVTPSQTWRKTDNPLMVLGNKLNQETVTLVSGCCSRREYNKVALQPIELSAENEKNF